MLDRWKIPLKRQQNPLDLWKIPLKRHSTPILRVLNDLFRLTLTMYSMADVGHATY